MPYQTHLDFQGKTMILVDPFDKYSAFLPVVAHLNQTDVYLESKNTQKMPDKFQPWHDSCLSRL